MASKGKSSESSGGTVPMSNETQTLRYIVGVFLFLLLFLLSLWSHGAITEPKRKVDALLTSSEANLVAHIGWIEHAVLTLSGADGKERKIALEAKVDTGAKTSSLHASGITIISKNGQEVARFTFSWGKERYEVEAPVQTDKRVKSSDGESEERQFIEVDTCIGKRKERLLVSLNDRGNMRYPLILGRRYLENNFLVDSKNKFLLGKPSC